MRGMRNVDFKVTWKDYFAVVAAAAGCPVCINRASGRSMQAMSCAQQGHYVCEEVYNRQAGDDGDDDGMQGQKRTLMR